MYIVHMLYKMYNLKMANRDYLAELYGTFGLEF